MIKLTFLFLLMAFSLTAKENIFINKLFPAGSVLADTVLIDDFENGLNNWTVHNLGSPSNPSLWHLTQLKSVSPVNSAALFDTITSSYPHLSYEALVSPSFLVPSNANVYLSFDVFIHLAPNGTNSNDFFDVEITTNGGSSWSNFSEYAYSGQQIGWKNFPFDFSPAETGDLTPYAGKTVQIRFVVSSDNADPNGEGVFIDNFAVLKTDCEFIDPFEPNNNASQAAPIVQGSMINAALCPVGDYDFYSFTVAQNDRINIVLEHNTFQLNLALFSPAGTMVAYGPNQLFYNAATAGEYKIRVTLSDIFTYTVDYGLYLNIINTKPDIIMVTDIPGDEGLQVRVNWQYSIFDPPDATGTIKDYHLFRRVDDTTGINKPAVLSNVYDFTDPGETLVIIEESYWDYILTVPAISPRPFSNYTATAPTLKDEEAATFIVAAVSKTAGQPVLWGTEGSGISSDNITPEFTNYSLSAGTEGITLDWDINTLLYADVSSVKIYKGMFDRFAPGIDNMIALLPPAMTSYTDNDITPGGTYFYKLAVTDFSGNISITPTVQGSVTSVKDENNIPEEIYLKQNYPNPFNPSTIIEFSLPVTQDISIKIYNILGTEIIQLAKGSYPPGNYKITFDASLIEGSLPSGIYFYSLTAGGFTQTKKLMLIK